MQPLHIDSHAYTGTATNPVSGAAPLAHALHADPHLLPRALCAVCKLRARLWGSHAALLCAPCSRVQILWRRRLHQTWSIAALARRHRHRDVAVRVVARLRGALEADAAGGGV